MPWPTIEKDVAIAFEGADYEIDVQRFEAAIYSPEPDAKDRILRMLRAVSMSARKCKLKPCDETVWFIAGAKTLPVVLVQERDYWIVRNHFRDCKGISDRQPAPRPAQPVSPPQGSLFDLSPGPRPGQKEYPD